VKKGEAAILGQHEIRQSFAVYVQRAGRHLMQGRFPYVAAVLVDQHYMGGPVFAAELGGQFQAPCTAADYHHLVCLIVHARSCVYPECTTSPASVSSQPPPSAL